MSNNMYTDLERSIYNHLKAALVAAGFPAVEVLNIQDDTTFPSQRTVIRFAKVYDIPNENAPRGPGSELLTPVSQNGQITSYQRRDYPDGYKCNYKINCCAESIEMIRDMEMVLKHTFRMQHPVYLYDSDTNTLTDSYCDISYRGFLNQDNVDLGFFSRAHILQFEVYDYSTATPTTIPAITSIGLTTVTTMSDPNTVADIVIAQ
jgi:hypothetical protein